MRKLIMRFGAALVGSLALFGLGATGLASASISITASGPGSTVIVNGSSSCHTDTCNPKPQPPKCDCKRHCHEKPDCHKKCHHSCCKFLKHCCLR